MNTRLVSVAVVLWTLVGACNAPTDPKTPEYWIARLDDAKEQEEAVKKLGELKDPKGVEPLIKVLKENEKLRPLAAQSLGQIGDPRAIAPLIAAIDVDPGTGIDEATKQKQRVNERALAALGDLKAKEAADVTLQVHQKARDLGVRMQAVRTMGLLRDPKLTPALIDILENDDNMYNKRVAAETLGEIGDPAAVPALIWAMYYEKGASVYQQASFALFQIGAPAIAPLIDTLEGKNERVNKLAQEKHFLEGAVQIKAIDVLGDLKAKQAEETMIKLWNLGTEVTKPLVRRSIAQSFANMAGPKGVALLVKNLDEPMPELRQFYVDALAELSDRAVLSALLASAKKGEPEAKHFAFTAYSRLADARELATAQKEAKANPDFAPELVRFEAAKECGENVDCWIAKLKDKNGKVRDRAGYALGRLGDKKAAEPLAAAVKDDDLDARYAIVWALARVGTKAQVPALEKIVTTERGQIAFVRVNEYLKRLVASLKRQS